MQVCQDLLNQYDAEGDSSRDHIITKDKTWCHHYKPELKWQFMKRQCGFSTNEKVQDTALNGQSDVHCLLA